MFYNTYISGVVDLVYSSFSSVRHYATDNLLLRPVPRLVPRIRLLPIRLLNFAPETSVTLVQATGERALVDQVAVALVRRAAKLLSRGRLRKHDADAVEPLHGEASARRRWVVEGQARKVPVQALARRIGALEALCFKLRVAFAFLDARDFARHAIPPGPSTVAPVRVHGGLLVNTDGDKGRSARLSVLREKHKHRLGRFTMQEPGDV